MYTFESKLEEGQLYEMSYFLIFPQSSFYRTTLHPCKMVHMKTGKVEVQFDDVADILPGKEDARIRVKVVRLWKVLAFLNPSKSSSLEMMLVDEKVKFIWVCLVYWLFVN
jgi:hypothetical protein